MKDLTEDPVCHMMVSKTSFKTDYSDMTFAFCSEQCRDRFLANPRLYIGFPGQKAPAQQGVEILKYRKINLVCPLDTVQFQEIRGALSSLMGVKNVNYVDGGLEITYDLIQITEQQIEDTLSTFGTILGNDWLNRLKRAFIHFKEESEISSLEVINSKKGCH